MVWQSTLWIVWKNYTFWERVICILHTIRSGRNKFIIILFSYSYLCTDTNYNRFFRSEPKMLHVNHNKKFVGALITCLHTKIQWFISYYHQTEDCRCISCCHFNIQRSYPTKWQILSNIHITFVNINKLSHCSHVVSSYGRRAGIIHSLQTTVHTNCSS
jgi:hypothetical protein